MRRLALGASIGTGLLVATLGALVAVIALGPAYSHAFIDRSNTGDIATLVAFLGMGVVVIVKRPANLVGWALLLSGLGQLLGGELVRVVANTMQPSHTTLWLRTEETR